eukprot:1196250-Prorocentrum_minimum.AAC.5
MFNRNESGTARTLAGVAGAADEERLRRHAGAAGGGRPPAQPGAGRLGAPAAVGWPRLLHAV